MDDFGKVLDEWERLESGKSRIAPSDKDETGESARPLTRAQISAMPVDASLDLHGLTAAAAQESLSAFFRDASERGLGKVLIIHGKGLHSDGGPVLGETVRRFLEISPLAGRHGAADRRSGGSGAVWVLVRKGAQRSR